jgi:hypothetical protein
MLQLSNILDHGAATGIPTIISISSLFFSALCIPMNQWSALNVNDPHRFWFGRLSNANLWTKFSVPGVSTLTETMIYALFDQLHLFLMTEQSRPCVESIQQN